jgi:hypothetical protein
MNAIESATVGKSGSVKDRPLLVVNNPEAGCFEAHLDQHLAGYLRYCIKNGEIWLLETVVSRQHCIDNLVPPLASAALETAREYMLEVRPLSPAIKSYLAIHPEYGFLVSGSGRATVPPSGQDRAYGQGNERWQGSVQGPSSPGVAPDAPLT